MNKFYFAAPGGHATGWANANVNIAMGLSRWWSIEQVDWRIPTTYPGPAYIPVSNETMRPIGLVKGHPTVGYTFFEQPLPAEAPEAAKHYDILYAGSNWNVQELDKAGIKAHPLIQGVNQALFPITKEIDIGPKKYIFSGGKFEYRKGQDIVLESFRRLQTECQDLHLVIAWENVWPDTAQGMISTPYWHYVHRTKPSGHLNFHQIILDAGVDPHRVHIMPLLEQRRLANAMSSTHIGVFPNRVEGGTNLMLMEYMSIGRPVIASITTGHADIINDNCAIVLSRPDAIEEIIAAVKLLLDDADARKRLGEQAHKAIQPWTWERAAETIHNDVTAWLASEQPVSRLALT